MPPRTAGLQQSGTTCTGGRSSPPGRRARRRPRPPSSVRTPSTASSSTTVRLVPEHAGRVRSSPTASTVDDGVVPGGGTGLDSGLPAVVNLDAAPARPRCAGRRRRGRRRRGVHRHQRLALGGVPGAAAAGGGHRARLGGGGGPLGRHPRHLGPRVRRRRRPRPGRPGRGCPSRAPPTGCARPTGTSRGTTSSAPQRSRTAAPGCTRTPRTTPVCSPESEWPHDLPPGAPADAGAVGRSRRHVSTPAAEDVRTATPPPPLPQPRARRGVGRLRPVLLAERPSPGGP